MHGCQTAGDLEAHEGEQLCRHGHALSMGLGREACQGGAVHQLHHQEHPLGVATRAQQLDDVWVVDRGGHPCLVQEHADELGVPLQVDVQPLERDQATRVGVTSQVDPCHAPAGNLA